MKTMHSKNMLAFLTMIAVSEGTQNIPGGDDGYRVIVGSTPSHPILFDSYATHPHQAMELTIRGRQVRSTAAGRYQILGRYADAYIKALGLPDFGHDSQDAIAIKLIDECNAIKNIESGDFELALFKCRSRWASLPHSGYDQHEQKYADLLAAYTNAGGTLV